MLKLRENVNTFCVFEIAVLPVAVSMMTPAIPIIFILIQKCRGQRFTPTKEEINEEKENANVCLKSIEHGSYAGKEAI